MPDGLGLFYVIVKTLFPPQDATEIDALLAEWEVTRALPRLADRPLLLWHGDADDVVPLAKPSVSSRHYSAKGWTAT